MLQTGKYEETDFYHSRRCVICLENFKSLDDLTFLPCDPRHHFHSACIETWLCTCLKCPICKKLMTLELANASGKYSEMLDFVKQKDEESFLEGRRSTMV